MAISKNALALAMNSVLSAASQEGRNTAAGIGLPLERQGTAIYFIRQSPGLIFGTGIQAGQGRHQPNTRLQAGEKIYNRGIYFAALKC